VDTDLTTKIVHIAAAREQRQVSEQDAWRAYTSARDKAERSQNIADGIAAGKAWAMWLQLFERKSA
jgi:hypothetical protein